MTDDRRRVPARRIYGRPRSEPGVPHAVDDELTPPPQAPPALDSLSLPDQVAALHASVTRHNEAFGSLWQIRHLGDRLDRGEETIRRVEAKVDSYTQSFARLEGLVVEFVMPGLKDTMGRVDELLRNQQHDSARLGQLIDAVNSLVRSQRDLGERLRHVENKVDKISDNTQAHAVRLDNVEMAAKALDVRVTALELDRRDRATALVERRRIFTWARAGIFGAVAAVGAVAKTIADWIGK